MFKKILSTSLIFILTLNMCINVFADSQELTANEILNGDSGKVSINAINYDDLDLEIQNTLNNKSLSDVQKNARLENLKMLEALGSSNNNIPISKTINNLLDVDVATQENGYFCGPATVYQTVKFLNGSSASQSVIGNAIGTTSAVSALAPMVNYINQKTTAEYVIITNPDTSLISILVSRGVADGYPSICRLKFNSNGGWPYSTNGHFLNATGYSSYGTNIYLTDPNIINVDPTSSGHYYVTATMLYNATNNHFAKEFAYVTN